MRYYTALYRPEYQRQGLEGKTMNRLIASVFCLATTVAVTNPSLSATLPKDASELSGEEVRAMYAGKSAEWKSVRVYFAPDGSAKLVRKDKKGYGEGKWSVSGNQMCMTITPVDLAKGKRDPIKDCYSWHKAGTKYFMRWSGDEGKADAFRDDEPSRLTAGDKVSKDFTALKK